MNFKNGIKHIVEVGWINTFRLNRYYFGLGGVSTPKNCGSQKFENIEIERQSIH